MLEPDMDPFGGGGVSGTGGLDWLALPFLIVPALLAAMGLYTAWSALREDAVVKRLLQQPPVPGTVVAAHVERFIAPVAGAPATGAGARVLMGLGVAVSALAFAWCATSLIGSSPF